MREPQFVERTTDVSTLFICLAAKLLTDIQEEVADMDTLSNVNEATSSIPCSGLTPAAIPPAKSSQTGVSVEYVPDANKNWYVLRASYGRELLAEELLIQSHAYAYVAKQYRYIEVNGRPKRVLDNMISNLVFAYLSTVGGHHVCQEQSPGCILTRAATCSVPQLLLRPFLRR